MWQLKILSLWKAFYPWGVVLRVPHQWLLDTHRWDLLPHINYGMPILHFGGARNSGGCRYCHTAPWKRAMRRLAHGLMRSRGVTRGLARDVTWQCVRLHPIRLNRAFRSDLMWWRTFVEDWNGISFLPPPTHLPQLQMASDAWGCGAWHGCNWFQLQWDERSADLLIMVKVYTYLGE